jgi:hypothetical protein
MTALRGVIMLSIGLTIRCSSTVTSLDSRAYKYPRLAFTNQLTNRIPK